MFIKLKNIVIVTLILVVVILYGVGTLYQWEIKQLKSLMTKAEQRKLEAITSTEENQKELTMEITRKMARGDSDLHLTVDTKKGLMILARGHAQLREMKIVIGKETLVGTYPDQVKLATPLGKRVIMRVEAEKTILDSGTMIYPGPTEIPDRSAILPGGMVVATSDLLAIQKSLQPGMVIYFY